MTLDELKVAKRHAQDRIREVIHDELVALAAVGAGVTMVEVEPVREVGARSGERRPRIADVFVRLRIEV